MAAPEVKPHKLRYYLERRDPDFDAKMAEVVSIYREVEQLKQAAKARSEETPAKTPAVAIISSDEKPGIQALANKAPDLTRCTPAGRGSPVPFANARRTRDQTTPSPKTTLRSHAEARP